MRSSRAWRAAARALPWLLLASPSITCERQTARPPDLGPVHDPTFPGGESPSDAYETPLPSGCRRPRQITRVFVGFGDHMTLKDFELTALEASRILKLLKARLCELAPAEDPEGSLRAALGAGLQLEIAAIHFTRDDAGGADAHVQLASAELPEPDGTAAGEAAAALVEPPSWVLKVVRGTESGWRIASAAPK